MIALTLGLDIPDFDGYGYASKPRFEVKIVWRPVQAPKGIIAYREFGDERELIIGNFLEPLPRFDFYAFFVTVDFRD